MECRIPIQHIWGHCNMLAAGYCVGRPHCQIQAGSALAMYSAATACTWRAALLLDVTLHSNCGYMCMPWMPELRVCFAGSSWDPKSLHQASLSAWAAGPCYLTQCPWNCSQVSSCCFRSPKNASMHDDDQATQEIVGLGLLYGSKGPHVSCTFTCPNHCKHSAWRASARGTLLWAYFLRAPASCMPQPCRR